MTNTQSTTGFADLGLPEPIVTALAEAGLTTTFPIQAATIPDALAGRDVLGRGRTGSGKTLAFGLPLIVRAADEAGQRVKPNRPVALVLTPTRELAHQVRDALRPYGRTINVFVGSAVGGESYRIQADMLDRGVHILIATPGRLADLVDQGFCSLEEVRMVVLDEADQMADIGFLPDVCALLDQVKPGGQRLLFSATLDSRVQAVVDRYLIEPATHSVDSAEASVPDMAHHVLKIRPGDKQRIISEIASRRGRTVLFVRSRMGADRTAEQLAALGLGAAPLHGGMSQNARTRTLAKFKDGSTPVLVATDVAARGIHVDEVDLVLNVDPPQDHRDYLHRAGRTARAGRSGAVITLALPHQVRPVVQLIGHAGVNTAPVHGQPGSDTLSDMADARDPQIAAEELRVLTEELRVKAAARRASDPRGERRGGGGGYGRGPREGGYNRGGGGYNRGGSASGGSSYGGDKRTERAPREGGSRPARESGYAPRDGGGYNRDNRSGGKPYAAAGAPSRGESRGGYSSERAPREGGYSGARSNDGYSGGANRSGGYSRDNASSNSAGGYSRSNSGSAGGYSRDSRSSYSSDNTSSSRGGYSGGNAGSAGGYSRDSRPDSRGGYSGSNASSTGGGYNRDSRDSRGGYSGGNSGSTGGYSRGGSSSTGGYSRSNAAGGSGSTGGYSRDSRDSRGSYSGGNTGGPNRSGGYSRDNAGSSGGYKANKANRSY